MAALAVTGLVAGGLWPLAVALATGRVTAYLDVQATWGANTSVLELARAHPLAPVMLGLVVVILVLLPFRPAAHAWGPELRAWSVSYPVYVLLTAPAAISTVRFFVLAVPLMWPVPGAPRSRREARMRAALVAVLALLGLWSQWYWVSEFLIVGPLDEQFGMP